MRPRKLLSRAVTAGLAVFAFSAAKTQAQDGFFFRAPPVVLEFQVGRTAQSTNSDIYHDLTTNLTLDKKDFAATSYAGTASFRSSDRTDVVVGIAYARSNAPSESRDFIGTDDLPITQVTSLVRVPFTTGLRFYPMSRGSAVGQYAWIPSRFTPFAGAGIGIMHYKLSQQGDFVDTEDLSIFTDRLESSGQGFLGYGEAGASYWLNQRFGLSGSARYTWSKAGMRKDFERFNDIDLRGVQATAGIAVRF